MICKEQARRGFGQGPWLRFVRGKRGGSYDGFRYSYTWPTIHGAGHGGGIGAAAAAAPTPSNVQQRPMVVLVLVLPLLLLQNDGQLVVIYFRKLIGTS